MTLQPSSKDPVQQDDTTAIVALINQHLQSENIEANVTLKDQCLKIVLQAFQTPEQTASMALIRQKLTMLQDSAIATVKVYGKQVDEELPDWQQEFQIASTPQQSLFSMFGAIVSTITEGTVHVGGVVVGTAVEIGSTIGSTAVQTREAITGAVVGTTGAIGNAATQTRQAIVVGAVEAGSAIKHTVLQTPASAGYLADLVSDSPLLKEVAKALKADWLIELISNVDVVRAEASVQQLKQKYPNDQAYEIAHRVMLEKAIYVGGTGLTSSLMPGFATALFAIDLATTMALQAEMVYQIACAYEMDLKATERTGEVLTIFGLTLGGQTAVKAGLGLLRNVPVAGAAIGASSNAVMLYALGHAACQFYETKLNQAKVPTLEGLQSAGETYLQSAIDQQVIMDQILVHLIAAGQPSKTWQQVALELRQMNFSPASLEAIAASFQSPPSLDSLLDRVDPNFAVALVAQCQKVAQLDGVITAEEAEIIDRINHTFKRRSRLVTVKN
ncbi:MAG TPA: hypothetical protein VL134_10385 [Leptolyngbya sp.]|jgi:uncharacterized protein (DUF697 family)|nr:hypothetical protein [Leptolyngbya sp.]